MRQFVDWISWFLAMALLVTAALVDVMEINMTILRVEGHESSANLLIPPVLTLTTAVLGLVLLSVRQWQSQTKTRLRLLGGLIALLVVVMTTLVVTNGWVGMLRCVCLMMAEVAMLPLLAMDGWNWWIARQAELEPDPMTLHANHDAWYEQMTGDPLRTPLPSTAG